MNQSLNKIEKLKSAKEISLIFQEGKSISAFPVRMFYRKAQFLNTDSTIIKAAFSVSKKHFKKAVDRNRIKRLLRENYRKNKYIAYNNTTSHQYAIIFLYTGKEMPDHNLIQNKIKKLLSSFMERELN